MWSDRYCDEAGANCFDPSSIAAGTIGGSGSANYITKFVSGSAIGNSLLYDNGTNVGIGTTSLPQKLTVNGNISLLAPGFLYYGSQYLYGDNGSAFYANSNHSTITQPLLRDAEGTQYGRLYGGADGSQFGLLD